MKPYIDDNKLNYNSVVDYAAVELSRVFSESADIMLTVSEMDTVTKATTLYIELIHLSRYYDEEYKGSNGNMERYRDGELLPLAIETTEEAD